MSRNNNQIKSFNTWIEFEMHFIKCCEDPEFDIKKGKLSKASFYWSLLNAQGKDAYWYIVDYHRPQRPDHFPERLDDARQLVCEYWENNKVPKHIGTDPTTGDNIYLPVDRVTLQ